MHELYHHAQQPFVHAFCPDPSSLSKSQWRNKTFHSIVQGDASSKRHLFRAIKETMPDFVVFAIDDNGRKRNSKSKTKKTTHKRTAAARALVQVLQRSGNSHVKVLAVSMYGTGPSQTRIGLGREQLFRYRHREILEDYKGQEEALSRIQNRTLIVRPTALTSEHKKNARIVEFGDSERAPSLRIDCVALARFVADKICTSETYDSFFGEFAINITGT